MWTIQDVLDEAAERAYRRLRERSRCSLADFTSGFTAAVLQRLADELHVDISEEAH